MTEFIGGGNKARKLEFLFAEALRNDADAVVSIGGTGSNHCRAVATFSGMLGFQCHLVLRKDAYFTGELQGNMLLDNFFGAHTYLVSREQYQKEGSDSLVQQLAQRLETEKTCKKVYPIPVGGSNVVGVWGYIEAINELAQQLTPDQQLDVITFASGSGGTAAVINLSLLFFFLFLSLLC
jgi:1-aminocyclopropane-1-carboxylate deaminase/D-cysteine desulfhydrase-like pyridoxal-dependent ACC family enzyme